MIEDSELRELFREECQEHLQSLDESLLQLERTPDDAAVIARAFRVAHSLKGAARMLGIYDVEAIAHHFEDKLGAARNRVRRLEPEEIDRMYSALDAIRQCVHEAVTGIPSTINAAAVVAGLENVSSSARESCGNLSEAPGASSAAPPSRDDSFETPQASGALDVAGEVLPQPVLSSPQLTDSAPGPARPVGAPPGRIETVRVRHEQLDQMMILAGELMVTKGQMSRRISEVEEMLLLWEDWNRDEARLGRLPRLDDGSRVTGTSVTRRRVADLRSRQSARLEKLGSLLQRFLKFSQEDVARLDFVAGELEDRVRSIRLLPLSTISNGFPRMVRDLARDQGKEVSFAVEGGETVADKRILEELKDPLMHLIRNAIDHGIESGDERLGRGKPRTSSVTLRASHANHMIVIEVSDDGRGLNLDTIKRIAVERRICSAEDLHGMAPEQVQALIFSPGFSTSPVVTDISGRGVGLDVVRANVEHLKGSIEIESRPGAGCTFRLELPITLATVRVLIVLVNGRPYAVPVEFVAQVRLVAPGEIFRLEGRETITLHGQPPSPRLDANWDRDQPAERQSPTRQQGSVRRAASETGAPVHGEPVSVTSLEHLLQLTKRSARADVHEPRSPAGAATACVIISSGKECAGLMVDAIETEQEIVLKPIGGLLRRVNNVTGAAILGSGVICIVLDVPDLLRTFRRAGARQREIAEVAPPAPHKRVVLLAEDSLTTRIQEKRILEAAGYEVVCAVDGLDAWTKLAGQRFDAVISDVEMPNLNGIALAARIREQPEYRELPIVLVTSLSSEADRQKGAEAGANAYITKPAFDQAAFLQILERLI